MSSPPVSRRTFLGALLGSTALTLAACAGPGEVSPVTDTPVPAPAPEGPAMPTSTLLVYFSRPGENYWNGDRIDLEVGNTEVLATMIAERTGCDVYRVVESDPYSASYDETVARNVREQESDARPGIAEALPDVRGYRTVILASPIWNVRPPMIMSTFTEAVPLAGTTLLPVTTHAMSGLGRAPQVYAALAPDAAVGVGLAVRGEEVAGAGADVDAWLREVGLV